MKSRQDATRQRIFATARSHSRRVRVAKVVLPAIAVVATVTVGSYMWVARVVPDADVSVSGSAIRDGKLVMADPKLEGFTSDEQPYSLRAARAIQDLTGSNEIELERIQATVPVRGGSTARIVAPAGVYNSDSEKLNLTGDFTVETTDGMRAELKSADIDLGSGNMETADPVRISMPDTTIEADRMRIEDNGGRMLFENRVKLVIQPGALNRPGAVTENAAPTGG